MPHRIDIDPKHSRAILKVVGQQLRASLSLSRNNRRVSESKSNGFGNWRNAHQVVPVGERGATAAEVGHVLMVPVLLPRRKPDDSPTSPRQCRMQDAARGQPQEPRHRDPAVARCVIRRTSSVVPRYFSNRGR